MMKVGITGGIGSGKTTVCNIFQSMGVMVYDADSRAKWLMNHHKPLKKKIRTLLGKEAYHSNGRLNRPFVASEIFHDKRLLQEINGLVHPAVNEDAAKWFNDINIGNYAMYEAALLVENGSYKNFAKLIVVTAPEELRIERVVKRDKVPRAKVEARIKNQLPQSKKVEVADFIIDNSGSQALIPQVWKIHLELTKLAQDIK